MNKVLSHLAVDAVFDQIIFSVTPEESFGGYRPIIWVAALGLQVFLFREQILAWMGLEPVPAETIDA